MNTDQFDKVRGGHGFVAALDQSGGSTPKALAHYGIEPDQYANEAEMFDRVHEMRTRITTNPAFTGDRVIGAILFEQTMDREVEGRRTGDYLWDVKGVVPFIKIDRGLAEEADGVQMMKPLAGLDELLERSVARGMFGTKARSFVKMANKDGIRAIVEQQFDVARAVLSRGLVPILEAEVDIHSPEKAEAEAILKDALAAGLDDLGGEQTVMLKLSLPSQDNFYAEFVDHPRVVRVLALSGGYTQAEACAKLAANRGVIASFSRALVEDLNVHQSDADFGRALDASIQAIYEASLT